VGGAADPQRTLVELADALRVLHQRLLFVTRVEFEKLHGRVASPGALLDLVLNDPLFAWLRPLSRQIADLDELASEAVDAEALEAARESVARLIDQSDEFRPTYLVYLQADPDTVIAHAAVRHLLARRGRPV
jgi:hypothetical protein